MATKEMTRRILVGNLLPHLPEEEQCRLVERLMAQVSQAAGLDVRYTDTPKEEPEEEITPDPQVGELWVTSNPAWVVVRITGEKSVFGLFPVECVYGSGKGLSGVGFFRSRLLHRIENPTT